MSRIKNIFKGNAGFTLIELLIVIVIIGILAAIAIPNIVGLTGRADEGAAEADLKTFQTSVTAYRADEGEFPTTGAADTITTTTDFDDAVGADGDNDFAAETKALFSDFIDKYDPDAAGNVTYTSDADGTQFTLTITLPGNAELVLDERGITTTDL